MRTRNIKKQIWINKQEQELLKRKTKMSGLNEAELIRSLINGYEPREKPDERFYNAMKEMRSIGNNLNQIARKANSLNFIDYPLYQKESEKWNNFMINVKREFLLPREIQLKESNDEK